MAYEEDAANQSYSDGADNIQQQQVQLPPNKSTSIDNYIDVGDYITPDLENKDYYPSHQNVLVGGTPSRYFGGQIPIFSGRGSLFPFAPYDKRARALEQAAYRRSLMKSQTEQKSEKELAGLFGDVKPLGNPQYEQAFMDAQYQAINDLKDSLRANSDGSARGMLEAFRNPRTPEQKQAVRDYQIKQGNIQFARDNNAAYADLVKRVDEADKAGNIVVPELRQKYREFKRGKLDITNPNFQGDFYNMGIYNNINTEINSAINTIDKDIRESAGTKFTVTTEQGKDEFIRPYAHNLVAQKPEVYMHVSGAKDLKGAEDYVTDLIKKSQGFKKTLENMPKEENNGAGIGTIGKTNFSVLNINNVPNENKEERIKTLLNQNPKLLALKSGKPNEAIINGIAAANSGTAGRIIMFNKTDIPENKVYKLQDAKDEEIDATPLGWKEKIKKNGSEWDLIVSKRIKLPPRIDMTTGQTINDYESKIEIIPYSSNKFNQRITNEFDHLTPEKALHNWDKGQNNIGGTKPKTVIQNGHTYTYNENTGQYE